MLLLVAGSCSNEEPLPLPPDDRPAEVVLQMLLQGCHGQRIGTFDRCALVLGRGPGGHDETITLSLPDDMRVDGLDGTHVLARGDRAWMWVDDGGPRELQGAEISTWPALRRMLGTMLLQPLHAITESRRVGPDRLEFTIADGSTWALDYDREPLVPRRLARTAAPDEAVVFVSHLHTGVTHIPQEVELGSYGRRHVIVLETDLQFRAATFALPGEESPATPEFTLGTTQRPSVPELQRIEACSVLELADPGSWSERKRLLGGIGRRLWDAGQTNGGDPFRFEVEGIERFAIPFRRDPDRAGKSFAPNEGETVRDRPGHVAAVVYAPEGEDYASRVAAGRALLDALLERQRARPSGPLRVVANLYFEADADARPEVLRRMDLRLELPVQ